MDHTQPYSDVYLQGILKSVNSIAMVGASPDKTKFSYGVLRVLNETGYDMIPVNPRPGLDEIRGMKVFPSLSSIDRSVDMVEVFRRPEDLMGITQEAIAIGAKVLWLQLGIRSEEAKELVESNNIDYIENSCTKMEYQKFFLK